MINLSEESYKALSSSEKAVYWVSRYLENAKNKEATYKNAFRESGKTRRSKEYQDYDSARERRFLMQRLKNRIFFELDIQEQGKVLTPIG